MLQGIKVINRIVSIEQYLFERERAQDGRG